MASGHESRTLHGLNLGNGPEGPTPSAHATEGLSDHCYTATATRDQTPQQYRRYQAVSDWIDSERVYEVEEEMRLAASRSVKTVSMRHSLREFNDPRAMCPRRAPIEVQGTASIG